MSSFVKKLNYPSTPRESIKTQIEQSIFLTLINKNRSSVCYESIKKQMSQQKKEILIMCQNNQNYQELQQKINTKIAFRNTSTYFNIIFVVKQILTGRRDQDSLKLMINQTKQTELQNNLLQTQNCQNPYSHLLALRLLKDTLLKVDYGFLVLFQSQLLELIFNIGNYDPKNDNEQRGRSIYLQNLNTTGIMQKDKQELEVIGFSVHKISQQCLQTMGKILKCHPYHPNQEVQKQQKVKQKNKQQSAQRCLTPRAITNRSNLQNQVTTKMLKLVCEQIKMQPFILTQSKFNNVYKKTIKQNVKYPEKHHYFKQKDSEKFKKQIKFNMDNKIHHIGKFYQFLVGMILVRQVEINKTNFHNLQYQFNCGKLCSKNKYLLILNRIIQSGDQYSVYSIIYHLTQTLTILIRSSVQTQNIQLSIQDMHFMKNKFLSISQIIDFLFYQIKFKSQNNVLQIKRINFNIYLALDKKIFKLLIKWFFIIFNNQNQSLQIQLQSYIRYQFYLFVKKWSLISSISCSNKQICNFFDKYQPDLNIYQKITTSLINKCSINVINFFINKPQMKLLNSDFKLLSIKTQQTKFLIQLSLIQSIHSNIQFLDLSDKIIKLAFINQKIFNKESQNQTSLEVNQNQKNQIDKIFKSRIQKFYIQTVSKTKQLNLKISQQIYVNKYKQSNKTKQQQCNKLLNIDLDGDQQIPKQEKVRPYSMDRYKLLTKPNDISKLTNRKAEQSNIKSIQTNIKPEKTNISSRQFNIRSGQTKKISNFVSPSNKNLIKRQQNGNSFRKSLQISQERLNLITNDAYTLRSASKRKYNRRLSASRLTNQQIKTSDDAISCPYIMNANEQMSYQPYLLAPSQKIINAKIYDQDKVKDIQKRLISSQVKQGELLQIIKSKDNTIKQLGLKHHQSSMKKLNRLSDKLHDKNLKNQQKNKIQQFSLTLNHKDQQNTFVSQNIKKVDKLNKIEISQFLQKDKNSSQFTINKQKIGLSKLDKSKFSLKIKKDLMKEKVLIAKNQFIQIGMITAYEKQTIFNKITYAQSKIQDEKMPKYIYRLQLKSSIYISPLVDIQKIQLQIKDCSWIRSSITSNKIKVKAKADCQYISLIQFCLNELNLSTNYLLLPFLTVSLAFTNRNNASKVQTFPLPILINKFFVQTAVTQTEQFEVLKKLNQLKVKWNKCTIKIFKTLKDGQKYFMNLKTLKDKNNLINVTKISFSTQSIYLCLRSNQQQNNQIVQYEILRFISSQKNNQKQVQYNSKVLNQNIESTKSFKLDLMGMFFHLLLSQ